MRISRYRKLLLIWAFIALSIQCAKAELRLIETDATIGTALSITLYWNGARSSPPKIRIVFAPNGDKQQVFVASELGDHFNFLGSDETHHIYRYELSPFPKIPFYGEGILTLELFDRDNKLEPVKTKFWVGGDSGSIMVTPRSLRLISSP